ncbi:hypothetical protein AltI4_28730 [Alteromonas sp. I4]|nr:hypothetical protein AltI4_28730 [Alteromonas sp. I4]
MTKEQPNNPLHGVTLEAVVTRLQVHYGWDGLAARVNVNCFNSDPSVKSSLKFLRKTQWAREKVEQLYISTFSESSPWRK